MPVITYFFLKKSFVSKNSKQLLWLLLCFNNTICILQSSTFLFLSFHKPCLPRGEGNLETSLLHIQLLSPGTSTTCICFKSNCVIVWDHLSSLGERFSSASSVMLHVFAFKPLIRSKQCQHNELWEQRSRTRVMAILSYLLTLGGFFMSS